MVSVARWRAGLLAVLGPSTVASAALAWSELPAPADVVISLARVGDFPAVEQLTPTLEDPAARALARVVLAAAALDAAGARRAVQDLAATGDKTRSAQAFAWSTLAGALFATGDYGGAEGAAARWISTLGPTAPPEERVSAGQLQSLAKLLSTKRPQRLVDGVQGRTSLHRNPAGLLTANARIEGAVQEAVVDTGANLSVLSTSAVKALGLVPVGGAASVQTSVAAAAPVRVALAGRVEIAGATLHDVAFLVLDDAALTLPLPSGPLRLDMIIGFPVLRALGAVTFDREGALAWGASPDRRGPENLYARGASLFVAASLDGGTIPLLLDTGASSTTLTSLYGQAHPELAQSAEHRRRTRAGAGGSVAYHAAILRDRVIVIDGRPVCLPSLDLDDPDPGGARPEQLGVIGQDLLGAYARYTIDFRRMRFEPGPVEPARAACAVT